MFIHATNIHQGGGYFLLESLLKSLSEKESIILSLDERMLIPKNLPQNIQIKRVKPSVIHRFMAEIWLARTVTAKDIVLCFGNLPPLFKLQGCTLVFMQNRYLIDAVKLNRFPFKVQLRLTMERLWLLSKISNVNAFIVQTPTMQKLLEIKTRGRIPVHILPFVADPNNYARSELTAERQKNNSHFVYIASGEPHKNHRKLIEAWCLLAKEQLFPSLSLTLDETRFSELCSKIEAMRQQYGLNVINLGELSHQTVQTLYKKSDALIYPSTFESFGLPLIEARQAGLSVLAAELDYVRDVLDPEQTFDPESPTSIARAVKRFIRVNEPALPLLDAKSFLSHLVGKLK
jgi:glycosyltransferase involved in cell wall biosynthesis